MAAESVGGVVGEVEDVAVGCVVVVLATFAVSL